jgi:hypothetical protein
MMAGGTEDKEHAMSQKLDTSPAVIGIDSGKNSFHIVGQNQRGAVVLRQKWSRGQVEKRTSGEQMSSGLPLKAKTLVQCSRHVSNVPKSDIGRDRKTNPVCQEPSSADPVCPSVSDGFEF